MNQKFFIHNLMSNEIEVFGRLKKLFLVKECSHKIESRMAIFD